MIRLVLALGPVLVFLLVLTLLDSYKLLRPQRILAALLAGAAAGPLSFMVNSALLDLTGLQYLTFAMVVAPAVEESLKAVFLIWCLKTGRAGFLVEAAILGFAVGAGFSLLENLYYLNRFGEAPVIVWVIRGLGTSVMHGSCTAIFAVVTRTLTRGSAAGVLRNSWPGLLMAVLLHGGFNRAMAQPVITTVIMLVALPGIFWLVYRRSERNVGDWVGTGFDRDQELLMLIKEGNVKDSPLGLYLVSLRQSFRAEMVTDMFCLLRLEAELSIAAKGALLLRRHGFRSGPGPKGGADLAAKLAEVRWLERSIGRAGLLALRPVSPCRGWNRGRWQRNFLSGAADIKGNEQDLPGADPP